MNSILLSVAIFFSVLSFIAGSMAIYMLWRRNAAFKELHDYMIRMEKYAEGIADIHGGLKTTILDHHAAEEEFITGAKNEIIDQIGFSLRWSEALSKLIRIREEEKDNERNGTPNPLQNAEKMHEIGVEIVEIAFDEKTNLERREAESVKEELADAKEELEAVEEKNSNST